MKYTRYNIYYYHYVSKCKKEKCIWKIFFKYTQIRQSNTNTNTNISSCGFSNTNTNTNTDICVFKYKYKYKYVFDPSPDGQPLGLNLNSLWPSDTIWRQRSGSTLDQVMACCLTVPSHYLNQCWLIISEVQWHSYQGNVTGDASTINH